MILSVAGRREKASAEERQRSEESSRNSLPLSVALSVRRAGTRQQALASSQPIMRSHDNAGTNFKTSIWPTRDQQRGRLPPPGPRRPRVASTCILCSTNKATHAPRLPRNEIHRVVFPSAVRANKPTSARPRCSLPIIVHVHNLACIKRGWMIYGQLVCMLAVRLSGCFG